MKKTQGDAEIDFFEGESIQKRNVHIIYNRSWSHSDETEVTSFRIFGNMKEISFEKNEKSAIITIKALKKVDNIEIVCLHRFNERHDLKKMRNKKNQ